MTSNADPVRALIEVIRQRFTSGNSIPIERAHITAKEWSVLEAALASAPPSATVRLSSEDRVVLMRLKDALSDIWVNGWIDGVRVIERILAQHPAAPSATTAVETPEEEGRRLAQNECIGLSDLYGTVSYENLEGERFDRLVAAFRDERWGCGAAQQQGGAE